MYVYDQNLPFDKENIEQWFIALKKGKAKLTTTLGTVNDKKLFTDWLANTNVATRASWDDEILRDRENDCVIFFYSSENVS